MLYAKYGYTNFEKKEFFYIKNSYKTHKNGLYLISNAFKASIFKNHLIISK